MECKILQYIKNKLYCVKRNEKGFSLGAQSLTENVHDQFNVYVADGTMCISKEVCVFLWRCAVGPAGIAVPRCRHCFWFLVWVYLLYKFLKDFILCHNFIGLVVCCLCCIVLVIMHGLCLYHWIGDWSLWNNLQWVQLDVRANQTHQSDWWKYILGKHDGDGGVTRMTNDTDAVNTTSPTLVNVAITWSGMYYVIVDGSVCYCGELDNTGDQSASHHQLMMQVSCIVSTHTHN